MPELPEVETVRRGLQPHFEGAVISAVVLRRRDLRFPFPEQFADRLTGRKVTSLSRRAKYLIGELDDGTGLICHLGMSGSWRIETDDGGSLTPGSFHHERSAERLHDHVVIDLVGSEGNRARATYNDPRRFGFMALAEAGGLPEHPLLAALGIEPTGNALDGDVLARLLAGRRTPLKSALLDQRLIAGLGNIYVCEALWRAGLSPLREAGTLSARGSKARQRREALARAIRSVIAEAIEAGGSSLRDHRLTDGTLGYFQHRFSVYDREGDPCPRLSCQGAVHRIVQAGRSTFYCPTCQR